MPEPLVTVQKVSKTFESGEWFWRRAQARAVSEVDVEVNAGETLGIVGESGSGKSTLLRIILRLLRPSSGRVLFEGRDIAALGGRELRALRRRMQVVFQDPSASFNPRHSVGTALLVPLEVHDIGTRDSRRRLVGETLELVGLNATFMERYPHQLSGGQRQRAAIARAIILRPSLVLADEPTSALDVSVQAQILNLFKQMRQELGLTYVFVSHNLGVIRYISNRVAVMHLGRIVESGSSEQIFSRPQQSYTRALLDAVPDPTRREFVRERPYRPPHSDDRGRQSMLEFNTFSIAARCARTGMFGVAVSTAVPGVGGICPFLRAGVGAVSTQSWVNPYLGIDGVGLLAEGLSAEAALEKLIAEDPGRDVRQVGLVDRNGQSATWSGKDCTPWFGHITGPDYAVQGNMLIGESTIKAMAEAFERAAALDLPERLLMVLEAGQAAGGDKRGRQSAALKVVYQEEYPYLDLRVDEHRHPVAELRRVFEVARHQYLPFIVGMPTRANPLGNLPEQVGAMLLTPPPYRPGGGGSA